MKLLQEYMYDKCLYEETFRYGDYLFAVVTEGVQGDFVILNLEPTERLRKKEDGTSIKEKVSFLCDKQQILQELELFQNGEYTSTAYELVEQEIYSDSRYDDD